MRNRNHEGYMDLTACMAIRHADKVPKKWKTKKVRSVHLTYQIGEVEGFVEAVRLLRR